MGDPAPKHRTFEELLAEIDRLPEYLSGEILEPGQLRVLPRPDAPHRRAVAQCERALYYLSPMDTPGDGAWWIEREAAIRFGDRLFNPDLAGFRVTRSPEQPDEYPITLLPDWCCEVLSPSTARDDRRIKLPHYARSGVGWVWLIDPEIRLLEVWQTERERPLLVASAAEDETPRLPPFDLEINLAPFWILPKPVEPSSP
ncbi:Uma2 family endonuclease [Polyangium jinanense]|uniref:Uma2 family endonuclease n=1 Tax=Polyangium jinanense TaxID=2829994 RepID=A0A9X3XFN8_9BACT|nr:Uma2 family endonuclease [Polyangium jinanense]MDC3961812.1 Uma2 family endonuclease [Polyangium jinanense]MDC3988540.1 Uma2 family endonuclease [Polyangium jinanense]